MFQVLSTFWWSNLLSVPVQVIALWTTGEARLREKLGGSPQEVEEEDLAGPRLVAEHFFAFLEKKSLLTPQVRAASPRAAMEGTYR